MKLLILLAWHYERLVRCGLSFGRLHPRSPDPVGACDALRKLILETYNFKPSKLSAAEQAEKRAWKMVESQAASQLPCLREALNEPKMDAGFSLTEAVSCCGSIRRLPQNSLLAAIGAKCGARGGEDRSTRRSYIPLRKHGRKYREIFAR